MIKCGPGTPVTENMHRDARRHIMFWYSPSIIRHPCIVLWLLNWYDDSRGHLPEARELANSKSPRGNVETGHL